MKVGRIIAGLIAINVAILTYNTISPVPQAEATPSEKLVRCPECSRSGTPRPYITPLPPPTPTPTHTPTPTPTITLTPTPSRTPTKTPTPTPTPWCTLTPPANIRCPSGGGGMGPYPADVYAYCFECRDPSSPPHTRTPTRTPTPLPNCTPPSGCPQAGVPSNFVGPWHYYDASDPYCSCQSSQPWTPSPTPTFTPTPTPTPCSAWKFEVAIEGRWGTGTGFIPPTDNNPLSIWLRAEMQNATSYCTARIAAIYGGSPADLGFSYVPPSYSDQYDDCISTYFGADYISGTTVYSNMFLRKLTPSKITVVSMASPNLVNAEYAYNAQFFFLNGQQVSELPAGTVTCDYAYYGWRVSPISLAWDESTNVDSNVSVVEFPLNPAAPNDKYSLWKASDKAPLLVYDPEHTGKVTSAAQLFGDWTFGGKRFASLGSDMSQPGSSKWRDGFEALESMDVNFDGEVSGEELQSLALWFDSNRNGISEKGEVKTLAEVGVTALYYSANRTDASTRSIFADKGYSRVVNGKTTTGASVDWYSDTAPTKSELLGRAFRASEKASSVSSNKEEKKSEASKEVASSPNVTGTWLWSSNDKTFKEASERPEGIIVLAEQGDGKIKGHSYIEVNHRSTQGEARTLTISTVTGQKDNGVYKLTVKADDTVVNSDVRFDPVSDTLTGTSTANLVLNGKEVNFSYTWKANRLGAK